LSKSGNIRHIKITDEGKGRDEVKVDKEVLVRDHGVGRESISAGSTELTEFIRDVKRQITESEDPRPVEGFWIGVQSIELEVDAVTESKKGGGVGIWVLHGEIDKSTRSTQRIKINLVTQDYRRPTGTRG
jgi:hypothetical protein